MSTGIRGRLIGVVLVAGIVALLAVMIVTNGESLAEAPRVRVSVAGLDSDVDLFADESGSATVADANVDVVVYEEIEQLRTAFNADKGHPRLILLVDPI